MTIFSQFFWLFWKKRLIRENKKVKKSQKMTILVKKDRLEILVGEHTKTCPIFGNFRKIVHKKWHFWEITEYWPCLFVTKNCKNHQKWSFWPKNGQKTMVWGGIYPQNGPKWGQKPWFLGVYTRKMGQNGVKNQVFGAFFRGRWRFGKKPWFLTPKSTN